MVAYETYLNYASGVEYSHNHAILVAPDSEYNPILSNDACSWVFLSYFGRCIPIRLLYPINPGFKQHLSFRASSPEPLKSIHAYDFHSVWQRSHYIK